MVANKTLATFTDRTGGYNKNKLLDESAQNVMYAVNPMDRLRTPESNNDIDAT